MSSVSRMYLARGAWNTAPGSHCPKKNDHSRPTFSCLWRLQSHKKLVVQLMRLMEGLCLKAVKRTLAGWKGHGLGAKMSVKTTGSDPGAAVRDREETSD